MKEQILIIDDARDKPPVLERILSTRLPDCVVLHESRPENALARAEKGRPSGILLNLQTPKKDGIDLCRLLKKNPATASIPVILMTAYRTSVRLRSRALEAGADDFLSRPINDAELVAKIKVMLRLSRAERALRERAEAAEERLRSFMESATDGFAMFDDELRAVACNTRFCELLRLSRESIVGRPASVLPPAMMGSEQEKKLEDVIRTGEEHAVHELELRPGGPFINIKAFKIEGGLGMIIEDATDQRHQREALRMSEIRYRRIFETAPHLITSVDRNGFLLDCNERALDVLGYTREELLGRSMAKIIHPDCREKAVEALGRVMETGGARDKDYKMVRKDGRVIDVRINSAWIADNDGKQERTICIIEDVTERMAAEARLLESEKRFRGLFDNMPIPYQSLDERGNFLDVNTAWCESMGYSPEEAIGRNFSDFLHPDLKEAFRKRFPEFKQVGAVLGTEFEMIKKSGETIIVSFTGRISGAGIGGSLRTHCVFSDITAIRTAQEKLEESRIQFKTLLDSMHDGVILADAKTKEFVWLNTSMRRMLGGSGGESSAVSFKDIHPEKDLPYVARQFERQAKGEISVAPNIPVLRRDGSVFLADVNASPVVIGGKPHLLGVFRDVTEDREAEAALRKSEKRLRESEGKYRRIIENMREDYFFYSHGTDGVFTYVSPSVEEVLGYPVEQFMTHYSEYLTDHPANKEVAERSEKSIAGEKQPPYLAEIYDSVKNKHWLEVTEVPVRDESGKVVAVEGVAHDITEQKRIEDARQEVKERLDAVLRAIPDHITILDGDLRVRWVNQHVRKARGGDIIGKPCRGHLSDCAKECEECHVRRTLRDGSPHGHEKKVVDERGRLRQFECVSYVATRDAEDRPETAIVLARDITDRKHAEAELEDSRKKLFQSQKLEAVGRLAGGVAHDFNNILTAISAYANFLLDSIKEGDPRREDVLEIKGAGTKAAALTRQLLAFSRKQVLRPKVLNLNTIIVDMEKLLKRTISEDITLKTKLPPSLGPVKADAAQLEQVILNLVVNASDAMPKGGKVVIETSNANITEPVAHPGFTLPPGRYAMLAVSDTGKGMDSETLGRIFEPFFTTKETGKGTGLGLATVYGIVRQSGGYISAYSVPNQGTTFKLYLPRVDEPVAPTDEAAGDLGEVRGSETILLVEDESAVRRTAERILSTCGYTVLLAEDGRDALRVAEAAGAPIDLLVTDVVMPNMDGRELVDRFMKLRPGTRVLFMSGYTGEVIAQKGILDPGTAFLSKPFSPYDLAQKVRRTLDRK